MKLPSLKVSIPLLFIVWCAAGYKTFGGVIFAYPVMWAVVGAFFYGLHVVTRGSSDSSTSGNKSSTRS